MENSYFSENIYVFMLTLMGLLFLNEFVSIFKKFSVLVSSWVNIYRLTYTNSSSFESFIIFSNVNGSGDQKV